MSAKFPWGGGGANPFSAIRLVVPLMPTRDSKACVKRPLSKRQKIEVQDQILLNSFDLY